MNISALIEQLTEVQTQHGDLPIHFVGGGLEFQTAEVKLVKGGISAVAVGSVTGPHMFQPDRLALIPSNPIPS